VVAGVDANYKTTQTLQEGVTTTDCPNLEGGNTAVGVAQLFFPTTTI